MLRTNFNINIDPDYGKAVVDVDRAFQVVVTPPTHNFSWSFFLLIPKMELCEEEETVLIKELSECVLDVGDKYTVYVLDNERLKDYTKTSPIIAYDHEYEEFVWLQPPKDIMH